VRYVSLVLALALGFVTGCGESAPTPPDVGGAEGKQIADLIDRMNDDNNSIPKLKATFAAGTPLGAKDAKTYPQYQYNLKGKPEMSGTTATATVTVQKAAGGTPTDKQWEFVKEGDKWKIKAAPLP
jgi:hypothetical protein